MTFTRFLASTATVACGITAMLLAPSASADEDSNRMSEIVLKISIAAENGDITPAQAAEYLVAAQNTVMAEQAYEEFEAKVVAAYEAGEIDRRQAGAKIAAFKKELSDKMYQDCNARMNAAVEEGTMTVEEVKEVWTVYKKMTDDGKEEQITRQDYANAQAKMQQMVDKGEITQAQMDAKLVEMRMMIGKSKSGGQPQVTRQDYANAQAKMQQMVDKGEITQAQMDARLVEMRKMIGKSKSSGQPQITRQDYANAQAKMQQMVDKGEITQEQMEARLGEMRRMIGRANRERKAADGGRANRERKAADGGRGEVSDECMALRSRLAMAVRNGDMTREEAGEIWNAECGSN